MFARAKADGAFEAEGGRVEIRYKKTDPRAYRAAAANLARAPGASLLPDDTCVPGEAVASKDDAKKGGAKTPRAGAVPAADPKKPRWVAYTDGACTGNPGPAGSGLVVIAPSGKMSEGFASLGTGTNNIAELTAIGLALEAIPPGVEDIVIHTDSKYAIGVLSQGWKAKANQELIAGIKKSLKARPKVALVYVPGHAGVPLNERADELAREAIRTGRSKTVQVD